MTTAGLLPPLHEMLIRNIPDLHQHGISLFTMRMHQLEQLHMVFIIDLRCHTKGCTVTKSSPASSAALVQVTQLEPVCLKCFVPC